MQLSEILDRRRVTPTTAAGAEDVPPLPSLALQRNMARACVEEQATGPYVAIEGPIRHRGPVVLDVEVMDELALWWLALRADVLTERIASETK